MTTKKKIIQTRIRVAITNDIQRISGSSLHMESAE